MNAIPTLNPTTLLGPGDFTDHDYDRWDAKAAAIDAAIDWRIDELQSSSFKYAKDTIECAMELIADNAKGERDQLNRNLLKIWQNRSAKPETTERKLRDYAVSVIAQILNDAVVQTLEREAKSRIE